MNQLDNQELTKEQKEAISYYHQNKVVIDQKINDYIRSSSGQFGDFLVQQFLIRTPGTILPGIKIGLGVLSMALGLWLIVVWTVSAFLGAWLVTIGIAVAVPAAYNLHQVRHWRKNADLNSDGLAGDLLPVSDAQIMLIRNGFRSIGCFYEPDKNTKLTRSQGRELLDEIYNQQDALNGGAKSFIFKTASNNHSYWLCLALTPIGIMICAYILSYGTNNLFLLIAGLAMVPGGVIGTIALRGQKYRADLDHDGLANDLVKASTEQIELLANGYRLLGQTYTKPDKMPNLSEIRYELQQINAQLLDQSNRQN